MHYHYSNQCQNVVDQIVEHYKASQKGSVVTIFGPCYSGKTTTAIWLARSMTQMGLRVKVAQPLVNRPTDVFDGFVETRDGDRFSAFSYHDKDSLQKVFDDVDVVIFNEIQFSPESIQETLFETIHINIKKGVWVVSAGLFYSAILTIFPISNRIAHFSESVFELTAICEACGQPNAIYSQRLINGKPAARESGLFQAVSNAVTYVPRCKSCHEL